MKIERVTTRRLVAAAALIGLILFSSGAWTVTEAATACEYSPWAWYCRTALGAGGDHAAMVRMDGTLWAWGRNNSGQVGDGTTTDRNLPTRIGLQTDWFEVWTGTYHTLAMKIDGSLWAWGSNAYFGQLGDGTTTDRHAPVLVTSTYFSSLSVGYAFNIAVKGDGTLWAWGSNTAGQLGDGTNTNRMIPTQIGTANDWRHVAAGDNHAVAIKQDGSLWAWGANNEGQLGYDVAPPYNYRAHPTQVGSDTDWITIAAGNAHTVAVKQDGSLWAWGANNEGQLGNGTKTSLPYPTRIGLDNDWLLISAGYVHTVAVKQDGSLWAWGYNPDGRLGDGTTETRLEPTRIVTDNVWVAISTGDFNTFALDIFGGLWAWGYNVYGDLGDGTNGPSAWRPVPTWIANLNDWSAPEVSGSVAPGSGQSGVPVTTTVSAILSDPVTTVDPDTISITVTPQGGPAVTGAIQSSTTDDGRTYQVVFTPSAPLRYGTTYTVTISAADRGGNTMAPYSYSFTTQADTTAPLISMTIPGQMSGVPVSSGISIQVSDAETGVASIVTEYRVKILSGAWGSWAPLSPIGAVGNTVNYQPALDYNETVEVKVTARDQAIPFNEASQTFSFTTQADTTAPTIAGTTPGDGSPAASVSTDVVVTFTDNLSGWSANPTVTLTITSEPLPQGSGATNTLYSNQALACTVNGLSCTATFDPSTVVPFTDLPAGSIIYVTASAADAAGNAGTGAFSFNTQVSGLPPATDDGDGISAAWKTRLGLPSGKRTLIIRPLYQESSSSTPAYWSDFKAKYHSTLETYFNRQFQNRATKSDGSPANVGLQIMVIGDPGNPYAPMRNVEYDPATDNNPDGKPPVNIITIVAKGGTTCAGTSNEVYGAANAGHTGFKLVQGGSGQYPLWSWARKGYTYQHSLYDAGTGQRIRYNGDIFSLNPTLNKPLEVGLHALACYMEEGVYDSLTPNAASCTGAATNCAGATSPCCTTQKQNTNDFADDPSKVAFNAFSYGTQAESFKITGPSALSAAHSTTGYSSEEVLTHTLIHEIVHALLSANTDGRDHCTNPCCPSFKNDAVERGWTETDLGMSSCSITYKDGTRSEFTNQSCTHGQNGSNDITKYGVVWNVSH
jgi:alpha-tubulin suppressor-like RCC1 family protein